MTTKTPKPDFWPSCPYPIEVFPMDQARYAEIVPDPDVRTALSGCLGRLFWEIASESIWDAVQANLEEGEEEDDGTNTKQGHF